MANDRGMKKWAPYKSLNEQEQHMNALYEKRSRVEKPVISDDLAEEINNTLCNANKDTVLIFTYYKNGHIYEIEQKIIEIDMINRVIKGTEKNIYLEDLLNVKEL